MFYVFTFGCGGSLLLHRLFSSCGSRELLSGCGARTPHYGGLSYCRACALGHLGSVVVAPGL